MLNKRPFTVAGAALTECYPFSLVGETKGGQTWTRPECPGGEGEQALYLWVRAVMMPACIQAPSITALSFLSASVWVQSL